MSIKSKLHFFASVAYNSYSGIKASLSYRNNNGFNKFFGKEFSRFKVDFTAFDEKSYLEKNPDLENIKDLYAHFVQIGYDEGREGQFFDKEWYSDFYKDVKLLGIDPLVHYNKFGFSEGRKARFIKIKCVNHSIDEIDYSKWLSLNSSILLPSVGEILTRINNLKYKPKISIIVPVYNPPLRFLEAAVDSILNQTYDNWELCIADDASTNAEIKEYLQNLPQKDARIKTVFRKKNGHISEASNSALSIATGEFIGLLDHDDMLFRDALFHVVDALNVNYNLDLIYSDEDKCDEKGYRFDAYFKSNFNYELLLAQNMICHFAVYRHSLIQEIGGFRKGFEGAQDYDLVLRFIEKTTKDKIFHIQKVLYHWRAISGSTALNIDQKSYAMNAGQKSVKEHLERIGATAEVLDNPEQPGHFHVRYAIPSPMPLISIIIPTRDMKDILQNCIDSILNKSTYKNFEIIIVDNQSSSSETLEYFANVSDKRIKIIKYDAPFNYSKINNFAAQTAKSEYILLLNNDIEVITPNWLEEMLSFAQKPDIGCVGARLWYPDDTLQHGGVILGIGGVAGHAHKYLEKGKTGYFARAVNHQALSAVTGACLLVKKSIFDEVNGLNEDLQVAFNDIDFCLKVLSKGYRNVWTPFAELYHYESKSRGAEDTDEKLKRFKKEREIMYDLWSESLLKDAYYNPNLSYTFEDFRLRNNLTV